ncbi:hypothetical protein QOM21_01180 [Streptomyces sp. Pv4-95]|uniref:hypothetical protein n=1 Tax=Streptomyces sp. Pv4-95 TaxID=3049543 RepID=UPI0038922342
MPLDRPRYLLVRAQSEPSPLYESYDFGTYEDIGTFTVNVPLDDSALSLSEDLTHALRSWSLSRPPSGFAAGPDLREQVEQGLVVAQRLAAHLGPSWAVRYWDELRDTPKWVCWACDCLHWERDSHGAPPHPVDLTVEGEFQFGPLRSEGFGDFFPDDPAAALNLSDGLVAALYRWADEIDTTLNLDIRDRVEGKYDDAWQRLFHEGRDLARQVARELGPGRTVIYKGLANGGLAAMTYVAWRGDRELPA